MSALAETRVAAEALADRVVALRSLIVRSHHARYRGRLSYEDVDDLYGHAIVLLLEKDPAPAFPSDAALRVWLDETLRRSALKLSQSASKRRATVMPADELLAAAASPEATPEQQILIAHEHDALAEYIAGLSPTDQRIALLHLWPSSQMTAKKISAEFALPLDAVRASIHRIAMSWNRYTALSVGTVCRKQMKYLERWQQDGGPMPLPLAIHARRCANCREAIIGARERGNQALAPLVPAFGLPGAAGGVLTWLVATITHVLAKVMQWTARLAPASKEAGGSMLLAGKGAAIVAVAATATAGVATVGVVTVTSGGPHPQTHVAAVRMSTDPQVSGFAKTSSSSAQIVSSHLGVAARQQLLSPLDDAAPNQAQGSAGDPVPGEASTSSHTTKASRANASEDPAKTSDQPPTPRLTDQPTAPGSADGGLSPTGKTAAAP